LCDFRDFAFTWVIPMFCKERLESGGRKSLKKKSNLYGRNMLSYKAGKCGRRQIKPILTYSLHGAESFLSS
jgi:hypothetical protein